MIKVTQCLFCSATTDFDEENEAFPQCEECRSKIEEYQTGAVYSPAVVDALFDLHREVKPRS